MDTHLKSRFGSLADGTEVDRVVLGAEEGLQAEILTLGGILRRLTLPTPHGRRELVLSLPDAASYERDQDYLGQIIGRFGNRIAGAAFELDGVTHRLVANDGANQLHGGARGFGRCVWRVLEVQALPLPRLLLGLRSPAGDQGYPGNLDVTAEFTLRANELRLRLDARCDAPTVVGLTYHPYFNLSGDPARASDEMLLRIAAQHYLPVSDAHLIPTGEMLSVAGTPFDFRAPRRTSSPPHDSHAQLAHGKGYDHCFVLDTAREWDAELTSPHSGVTLQLRSSLPGLQFYGGQWLGRGHPGLQGLCLEPEQFPNSPNDARFPSPVLRPGEICEVQISYRFLA